VHNLQASLKVLYLVSASLSLEKQTGQFIYSATQITLFVKVLQSITTFFSLSSVSSKILDLDVRLGARPRGARANI
jgi:hypothetical protein